MNKETIKKIENVVENGQVVKTIMTISVTNPEGEEIEVKQSEIYLAYIDGKEAKRYVVYTDVNEPFKDENDRIPFTLGTITQVGKDYVLEATSEQDHREKENKVLEIIGLNIDKTPEERVELIKQIIPGFSVLDLDAFQKKIGPISISSTNKPKKANMPIFIANIQKDFYLHLLNKELKKIYNAQDMSEEEKEQEIDKLNQFENKFDEIEQVYEQDIENRGGITPKVQKGLDDIEMARQNIENAKNRIEELGREQEEEVEEVVENSNELTVDEKQQLDNLLEQSGADVEQNEQEVPAVEVAESIGEVEKNSTPIEETVEPTDEPSQQEEPQVEEVTTVEEQVIEESNSNQDVEQPIVESENSEQDNLQKEVISKIEEIVISYVSQIRREYDAKLSEKDGTISSLTVELNSEKEKNTLLEQQLEGEQKRNYSLAEQLNDGQNIIGELRKGLEDIKQQSDDNQNRFQKSLDERKEMLSEISTLRNETDSQKQQIVSLQEEVNNKNSQINQQNSNIEDLREEGRKREEASSLEIQNLKNEVARLKQYEVLYSKMSQMMSMGSVMAPNVEPAPQPVEEEVIAEEKSK